MRTVSAAGRSRSGGRSGSRRSNKGPHAAARSAWRCTLRPPNLCQEQQGRGLHCAMTRNIFAWERWHTATTSVTPVSCRVMGALFQMTRVLLSLLNHGGLKDGDPEKWRPWTPLRKETLVKLCTSFNGELLEWSWNGVGAEICSGKYRWLYLGGAQWKTTPMLWTASRFRVVQWISTYRSDICCYPWPFL